MSLKTIYEDLKEKPYKYSFSQACYILEKTHEEAKKFGTSTSKKEAIKLIPYIHASTPASACIKFSKERNALLVNAPSLIGYNGIFPKEYAEKIFFQEKQKNYVLSDFFNIFNHRYYSIKYKLEKNFHQGFKDNKFEEVFEISGLKDNQKLKNILSPFLSLILLKNKTKRNLKRILENLSETEIEIEEFAKRWFDIPEENQLKLDGSKLENKAIGNQTETVHATIKIIFWFENFKKYMQYFNNQKKQENLKEVIKYYLNGELEYKIELKIKQYTTKTFHLNKANKLGFTTWI